MKRLPIDVMILGSIGICLLIYIIFFLDIIQVPKMSTEDRVRAALENAYFEGQKDAIEGDVRIMRRDTGYEWIKSPWEDGKLPVFDCSKPYIP